MYLYTVNTDVVKIHKYTNGKGGRGRKGRGGGGGWPGM